MLSDFIHTLERLHQINGGILFAIASFALFVWFAYKLMQALIHNGNNVVIAVIGFFALVLANQAIGQGQVIQTILFVVPLVFIGHEVYKRLIL